MWGEHILWKWPWDEHYWQPLTCAICCIQNILCRVLRVDDKRRENRVGWESGYRSCVGEYVLSWELGSFRDGHCEVFV